MQEEFSLGELAVRFGLELRGEPGLRVSRVATLSQADAGQLELSGELALSPAAGSRTHATAVILDAQERWRTARLPR